MNKKNLLLSVTAMCALAAAPGLLRAEGCKNNCSIDVEVTADAKSCKITKPLPTDKFAVAANTTVDITWKLKAPQDFQFTGEGIKFKGKPVAVPADTFVFKNASKVEWVFTDKNDGKPGKKGEHKYSIFVEKGGIKCNLDPSVVNE